MLFVIISAIVAVVVAILAVQNSMMVDLNLFAWSFRLNLVLVVLLSVICGLLLGLVWGLVAKTRGMWRIRKLNEQIAMLEDDKRILRDKVEQMMKAQGDAVDGNSTATTPAAAAQPATATPSAPASVPAPAAEAPNAVVK